jgi:hypothetical protein
MSSAALGVAGAGAGVAGIGGARASLSSSSDDAADIDTAACARVCTPSLCDIELY